MPRSHSFRTMGTVASLIAPVGRDEPQGPGTVESGGARRPTGRGSANRSHEERFAHAAEVVERTFVLADARFSRFRPDSELSRVNARAGSWTRVSIEFARLLKRALDAARETDGLFDPTILPALISAGYDRDFDELIAGARDVLHPPVACGRWPDVKLDGRRVRMPLGVALDFGGIAKGWTVDVAAGRVSHLLPWAIVDGGGDLRAVGELPADGIEVAVEDPRDPTAELVRLRLSHGALATSSTTSRSWGPNLHQLIDPRTGLPSVAGITQATAWGETCTEAEVRAKWALLSGVDALDVMPCVLVADDGEVVMNLLDGPVFH